MVYFIAHKKRTVNQNHSVVTCYHYTTYLFDPPFLFSKSNNLLLPECHFQLKNDNHVRQWLIKCFPFKILLYFLKYTVSQFYFFCKKKTTIKSNYLTRKWYRIGLRSQSRWSGRFTVVQHKWAALNALKYRWQKNTIRSSEHGMTSWYVSYGVQSLEYRRCAKNRCNCKAVMLLEASFLRFIQSDNNIKSIDLTPKSLWKVDNEKKNKHNGIHI